MMAFPAHPGEILRAEVIDDLGISVNDLAQHLGISRVTLSRVLNAHAAITPTLARRLELAGLSTARAWLAMQAAYDLAHIRDDELAVQPLRA